MDDLLDTKKKNTVEQLMHKDPAAAAAKIQEYLDEKNNAPLNIAIIGESGAGKSTFVNYFRGLANKDEGAAPTGVVETTMEIISYPHPHYPNTVLWDLPGIGTTKFPADKYLEHVGFEKFDFFIIVSADRFRENDVKIAKEIQKIKKKFYFVRSKIDHNLQDEKKNQKNFNEQETLNLIRNNCLKGLKDLGFDSPRVFLLASPELHKYDFPRLHQTLEEELPGHKRLALLLAMPIISLEVIEKKKKALKAQIKYVACTSAVGAAVPIPGFSTAVDISLIVSAVTKYVFSFGLDAASLKRLSASSGVPFDVLKAETKSLLSAENISKKLVLKVLSQLTRQVAIVALEEGIKWIPFIGAPVAMALSFAATYDILCYFLNLLAEDAQRVFKKALGLDTSV